jgi:hypothetical protein
MGTAAARRRGKRVTRPVINQNDHDRHESENTLHVRIASCLPFFDESM